MNICQNLIKEYVSVPLVNAIFKRREKMKELQEKDRYLGDQFLNGYHCGIQAGLEAAINIIKETVNADYGEGGM